MTMSWITGANFQYHYPGIPIFYLKNTMGSLIMQNANAVNYIKII